MNPSSSSSSVVNEQETRKLDDPNNSDEYWDTDDPRSNDDDEKDSNKQFPSPMNNNDTNIGSEEQSKPEVSRSAFEFECRERIQLLAQGDEEAQKLLLLFMSTVPTESSTPNASLIMDLFRIFDYLELVSDKNRGKDLVLFIKNLVFEQAKQDQKKESNDVGNRKDHEEEFKIDPHYYKLNRIVQSILFQEAIAQAKSILLSNRQFKLRVEISKIFSSQRIDEILSNPNEDKEPILNASRQVWQCLESSPTRYIAIHDNIAIAHLRTIAILITLYLLGSTKILGYLKDIWSNNEHLKILPYTHENILLTFFNMAPSDSAQLLRELGFMGKEIIITPSTSSTNDTKMSEQ